MAQRKPNRKPKKRYNRNHPKTKKPDRVWDFLNDTMRETIKYVGITKLIVPIVENKEIWQKLEEEPERAKNVRNLVIAVGHETEQMVNQLEAIMGKHANRTGSSRTEDELIEAFGIAEEYFGWAMSFEGTVITNVMDIISSISEIVPNNPDIAAVRSQIQEYISVRQAAENNQRNNAAQAQQAMDEVEVEAEAQDE